MALVSGYGALAANTIFVLASVPLALHYLPKEEFGLWALTSQVMVFIRLLDIGMTGAAFRILIDYKDKPEDGEYGEMLKTSALMFFAQATIMIVCATALIPFLPGLFHVPDPLHTTFTRLLLGTCVLFASTYAFSVFTQALFAHQRQDIIAVGSSVALGIQLTLMWVGFRLGWGIWSMLLAFAGGRLWSTVFCGAAALRLRLVTTTWLRQPVRRERFLEVFLFGKDRFFVILGQQIVLGAPAFIVTRFLGLEAMAAWKVGTQVFVLCQRALSRIQDAAYPALVEMHVRHEKARLYARFKALTVLCFLLAAPAAVGIGALNTPFVRLWTSGRIAWGTPLDLLLAVWLLLSLSVRCHWTTTGLTKRMGFMRGAYFVEAVWLTAMAVICIRMGGGIASVLVAAVVASVCMSYPYTLWRTARYFDLPLRRVAVSWMWPAVTVAVPLAAATGLTRRLTAGLGGPARLLITAGVLAVGATVLLLCRRETRQILGEAVQRLRSAKSGRPA